MKDLLEGDSEKFKITLKNNQAGPLNHPGKWFKQ